MIIITRFYMKNWLKYAHTCCLRPNIFTYENMNDRIYKKNYLFCWSENNWTFYFLIETTVCLTLSRPEHYLMTVNRIVHVNLERVHLCTYVSAIILRVLFCILQKKKWHPLQWMLCHSCFPAYISSVDIHSTHSF